MEKISNVITLQGVIPLGKQGENGVVEIIFPQPPGLLAENWTLLHLRATDAAAYPVPLEKRDGALVWSISSGDTAIDGLGKAELICTSKDGQILKSRTYFTKVAQSLDPGQSVPDPVQPWYEKLLSELQGVVKTVNGVAPDETGNVESNTGGDVKTVNGIEPDENGNVEISIGAERTEDDVTGSVIAGEYASAKTGNLTTGGSYSRTDYIPVEAGDIFYYTGRINNSAGVAGYNAEKKFVQSVLINDGDRVVYTDQELSIGSEVKYIIASTMGSSYPVKLIRSREATKEIKNDSIDAEKLKSEDYILTGLNNFAAFSSFTAIGDSLTAGLYPTGTNESGDTTWSQENAEKFCWPSFLAQLTGASHLNYGISGATAKKWCENTNGLAKMLAGKKTQAYIIGLGFNDQAYLTDDYPLGTIDDINTDDYTQNGDTFAGWYGKVIQNIMEFAPDAKIFCLNNPRIRTSHGDTCFELIREICGLEAFQGHVFFVDLRKWVRFYNAPAVEKYRVGVHYSAPGYCQCAKIMLPAISEVMNENPGEFKTIPLIPYEEVSYTSPSINLSDENYEYGYLSATGELTDAEPAEAAFRTANFIPVEGGRMLCWNADTSTVQSNTAKVVQYDASQNCIVEMADVPCEVNRWTSNGITLNADTKYVRVAFYTETAADLSAVKLNLFYHEDIEAAFADPGATFQYHPYRESTATVADLFKYQSPLTGKKIVYDGDSICESRIGNDNVNLNNGGGYAKLIADRVSGRYENHAVGGSLLAEWNGLECLVNRISELPTDGDLYCFEGGINDFRNGVRLGTDTYHEYEYGGIPRDTTSVLGALDYIFYYATTHFVGKPICFVISHHIVDPDDTGDGDYTYQELHDAIVKVCKKWAIPYYDAYYTSGLCGKNEVQSNAYLTANASGTGDGCHPNEEGYKRYYVPQLIDLFERIMPVE